MSEKSAVDKQNTVLKEIINNSWNGLGIIDPTTKFVYVNKAFSPILGFKENELMQIKFESLLLPKYKKEFRELIEKNIQDQYHNNMRVACIRRDKAVVYLDVTIKVMSNKKYIVINANDITQTISDHETFDKYVIQAHVDNHGTITKVSEAFCRLTHFTEAELIGKSYDVLMHESINEDDIAGTIWSELIIHSQWNGNIASKTKNGDIIWVDIIIKPINNKYGDVTGYSAIMFDITSEVNLEKNREMLEETITSNESKLKIMGETLRTIAHEWRQPLNAISLEAQNLLLSYQFADDGVSKDEAIPILEEMQSSIGGLSNMIGKFQYFTELQGEKKEAVLDGVCIKAINVSSISKDQVEDNIEDNINFLTYESELATSIASILDNAKEANDKKTNSDEAYIKLDGFIEDENIIIKISNNGGHIDEAIMEDIFKPYFSTKEVKNGVGLSLYISKMIVELHLNGKIEVENKEDNTVVFTINIPMEQ
ncbi:MAG: PAS domain S-box protein [Campylobacterota bacterium]|nr:PAS domain S-box protein [Campylobacterota bacterium]